VLSGEVKAGQDVYNTTRDGKERMGQLFIIQGKERKEIGGLSAGDIGAVVKLKNTHTGDTLCASDHPIQYPAIIYPEPIIDLAMVTSVKGIEEKLAMGLSKLVEEDPTFRFKVEGELRQTIIFGMGEVQIEMAVKRLKQKFSVDIDLVKPNIPYRETIRRKADGHKKYKKQSGGRGQYGDAYLHLAPKARGEGYEFVNGVVGGAIPGKFIPAVEKGVVEAMENGVLAGYRVVDLRVELYDGSYHDVDSSEMAFKRAGSMAFKEGFMAASPVLLEPIYDVEVRVPDTYMGDVMGDLSGRRGKISGMDSEGGMQLVRAKVPLPELFRYSTTLRSLTQGAGEYSRKFSHYEEVPREQTEKIIASAEKKKSDDDEE
jgi:elongation factor G